MVYRKLSLKLGPHVTVSIYMKRRKYEYYSGREVRRERERDRERDGKVHGWFELNIS